MEKKNRRYWLVPVLLVALATISLIVMLLWNWILPTVSELKTISYWQAMGLFVLSRILFGKFWKGERRLQSARFGSHQKHEKWMNMTDEERAEFIHRRRAHYHRERGSNKREFRVNKDRHGEHYNDDENKQ